MKAHVYPETCTQMLRAAVFVTDQRRKLPGCASTDEQEAGRGLSAWGIILPSSRRKCWYTLRHGPGSKLCKVKEARHKRAHLSVVSFLSHEISGTGKSTKIENRSVISSGCGLLQGYGMFWKDGKSLKPEKGGRCTMSWAHQTPPHHSL